ncbi:hypothetical protein [Aureispira sp. CCB-E]|uniref:hypothetical protein n=1 Tax=Aureispira sp. CCB-E TaxID=3051121 RepID=UPI0028695448|nr:hypothetical protein [Aureispira sp. CCB-E]WMX12404.1 hypothetical protein QP953_16365 [Aureispira sp. CCB-E]
MMKKTEVIRIYTPITAELCVATPNAMINGKKSYMPMPADAPLEWELISEVEAEGGIVDANYSLISSQKGHSEEGQIELTVLMPNVAENPAKTDLLLGVNADSLPIFGVDTTPHNKLEVSGTFGADTLNIIADLAKRGTALRINGIHVDADDDKHFTGRVVERQFAHDGTSTGDNNHVYPKSDSKDQQTTIRTLTGINAYLDGFSFLKMPIYKGVAVNMTIETTYIK